MAEPSVVFHNIVINLVGGRFGSTVLQNICCGDEVVGVVGGVFCVPWRANLVGGDGAEVGVDDVALV